MIPTGLKLREGLQVGVAAYLAPSALYCVFDLLAALGALYSVNLLGMALFRGQRDAAILRLPIPLDLTAISWYSGLHLALLLALGIVAVGLIRRAERHPLRPTAARLGTIAGIGAAIVLAGAPRAPIREVLPWSSIVVANALAVLLVGLYLLRRHPVIRDLLARTLRAAR